MNSAIATNMTMGTRMVWHYCWMNCAVVLMTIIPMRIFLKQHIRIKNEIPAAQKQTIATGCIQDGFCSPTIVILILPCAVSSHTTPKLMMAAKYKKMMLMTRQPPQARMNNSSMRDSMSVMKMIANEIGQVCFKSAID